MIDLLYSWVRNRRVLDCPNYKRIIEKQTELVLEAKENYDASKKMEDIETYVNMNSLLATYLVKDGQFEEALTLINKIMDFCSDNMENRPDLIKFYHDVLFLKGDVMTLNCNFKAAYKIYDDLFVSIVDKRKNKEKFTKEEIYSAIDAKISALSIFANINTHRLNMNELKQELMFCHKLINSLPDDENDIQTRRYLLYSYLRLGKYYIAAKDYQSARNILNQTYAIAKNIFQKTNQDLDYINYSEVKLTLAKVHLLEGDSATSLILLHNLNEKLHAKMNENMFLPTVNLLIDSCKVTSKLYNVDKNDEKALSYALYAKQLARIAKNTWDCPFEKINYARTLHYFGVRKSKTDLEKSISDTLKACAYLEPYLDNINYAEALDYYVDANVELANYSLAKSDGDSAIKYIDNAIKYHAKQQIRIKTSRSAERLIELYEKKRELAFACGDYNEVNSLIDNIVEMRCKLANELNAESTDYGLVISLRRSGEMYYSMREIDKSCSILEEALRKINDLLLSDQNITPYLIEKEKIYDALIKAKAKLDLMEDVITLGAEHVELLRSLSLMTGQDYYLNKYSKIGAYINSLK